MTVLFIVHFNLGFTIDSHGDYILPYTGTYQVRVMQTRNDARKGKTPNYTLQLTIRQ